MHVGERNIFVTFFGNLANRSLSVKQSWGKIKCLLGDIVMYPDVMSNEISSLLIWTHFFNDTQFDLVFYIFYFYIRLGGKN